MRNSVRDVVQEAAGPVRGVSAAPGAVMAGPCRLSFGHTAGLRNVMLENGLVRAEVLLDKGANVRQFWHLASGARTLAESRDWAERLAEFRRNGCYGSSYSDCYEGGWQDVLPARAQWEGGVIAGDAGVGEAAIIPWEVRRVVSSPAAVHVTCRARLPRCGLDVVKRFGLREGRPALRVETTVRNASGRPVYFNWTQHPALGGDVLDGTARIMLPGGQLRARRYEQASARGAERGGGTGVPGWADGTQPRWVPAAAILSTATTTDTFVTFADIRGGDAAVASDALGLGVRLRWDPLVFPHAWLWCARSASMQCVALEPSTTCLPEMATCPGPEILHLLRPGDSMRASVELSTFTPASGGNVLA